MKMITGRGGSTMRGGRIRPPRRPMAQAGGADEFEANWQALKNALRDIHMRSASGLAFEQLYRHAYKIVLKKAGERLYNEVKGFEQNWFAKEVIPPIFALITKNLISVTLDDVPGTSVIERRAMGGKFLKAVRDAWERHNTAMNMIADILMYLDRGYAQDQHRPSIFAATIGLFRDHILRVQLQSEGTSCSVFQIVNATIFDQVNMEREGDVIDKALLRSCVSMFESLHETDDEEENEKLYLTVFEPEYLASSRTFYKKECERLLRESDASTWLRTTQRRLQEEEDRCRTTVSIMSVGGIAQAVQDELISMHLQDFMNLDGSGFRVMIDNDRVDDLKILYQLVDRVDDKKTELKKALSNRVVELGSEIEKVLRSTDFSVPLTVVDDPKPEESKMDESKMDESKPDEPKKLNAAAQQTAAAIKWVDDVLALKDRFDRLLTDCFEGDQQLHSVLTKSYSNFINTFDRSPEYLSLFIDDALKRGVKGLTESEVDVVLEKAITLLSYISDKDRFEVYYQKHLGKRLLHQKSESLEIETEMISRMKRVGGNTLTSKFEGMFRDMSLSKDITENYRQYVRDLGATNGKQIDFTINVLGGNNWPTLVDPNRPKANFPPEIKRIQESFFKFYEKDRTGRKLTYMDNHGTADVTCVFPKIPGEEKPLNRERRYELNVPTHAMLVLLLFNDLPDGEWLSFEEIQAQTNISQNELINVLTALTVPKQCRILLKDPPAAKGKVQPDDRLTFHRQFYSKKIKIKMPTVSATKVESTAEKKDTDSNTLEQRKYMIDAAIVRLMKSRKELLHQSLITETIQQLSGVFRPEVALIKQRIEDLIGREYLERNDINGKPGYTYLAAATEFYSVFHKVDGSILTIAKAGFTQIKPVHAWRAVRAAIEAILEISEHG